MRLVLLAAAFFARNAPVVVVSEVVGMPSQRPYVAHPNFANSRQPVLSGAPAQNFVFANDLFGRSKLHPSRIQRFQKYFARGKPAKGGIDVDMSSLDNMQSVQQLLTTTDAAPVNACDAVPNVEIGGRSYIDTSAKAGCSPMTWAEASDFCRSSGMAPVSLGSTVSRETAEAILNVTAQRGIGGFWTGGYVAHPDDAKRVANAVVWSSASVADIVVAGKGDFSHSGEAGKPQPDNWEFVTAGGRDPARKEHCVAVLNNRYGDGQKLHDLACYYKLYTVCREVDLPLFDQSGGIFGSLFT